MRRALVALALVAAGCNLHRFFDDPRCYTTDDCTGGQVCSAYLCVGPQSLGTGRKCWATRDCQVDQTCQLVPDNPDGGTLTESSRCLPAGTGAVGTTCSTSLDCQAGLRCDLVAFSGTCATGGSADRNEACTSTADCIVGLTCNPATKTCQAYSEAYPVFAGVACPDEVAPFRAIVEVPRASTPLADFFRLPFPSDVRVANGALDMSDFPRPGPTPLGVDLVSLYVDALVTDFDGFSAVAPVTFRFSADVDPATLASAATYVDLADGSLHHAVATAHLGRTKFSCADRVVVEHDVGDVLLPKHTYAVLVHGIKSPAGALAAQDGDFTALVGGTRPSDASLASAWDLYAPLRAWLASNSVPDLQAAMIFTTGDTTAAVEKIHAAVEASPAPVLSDLVVCDTGVAAPCADGGTQRVCGAADPGFYEIQGRMTFPIFQAGTEPYLDPGDGGGIALASPTIVRTEEVCVAFTIPKSAPPANGWPLAVYHHGTGGSYRSFIDEGIGATLASGTPAFAAMSFDAIEHGSRKNGSTVSSDDLVFNVLNPHAARDNNIQSGADVLQAFRSASVGLPASVTGSAITFDTHHVVYFGHSQGGNAGHIGLSYATDVHAAVLSGSGGGVADGLLTKTNPINIADGMAFLIGEALDRSHPAMIVFQTYFDRSDPLVYAPLLVTRPPTGVPSKHVLHTYGLGDTYAPPLTLGNITQALGVPIVKQADGSVLAPIGDVTSIERPVIGNLVGGDGKEVTAATFQYDPMGAYDGHFVALMDPSAIDDWSAFFTSYVLAGTPHVP